MGNCRNCVFWKKPEEDGEFNYAAMELGQCVVALALWDCTEYGDEEKLVIKKGNENKKAFVLDGSGYRANLLTRPNFGCVEYKPVDGLGAVSKLD